MSSQKGIVVGAIAVALTVAGFFLIGFDLTGLNLWALAFLVIAEVVSFTGFGLLRRERPEHNQVFLQAGVGSAISIYGTAAVAYSLLAGVFRDHVGWYVLLGLVILALFAVTTLALTSFSRSTADQAKIDSAKVNDHQAKRGGF